MSLHEPSIVRAAYASERGPAEVQQYVDAMRTLWPGARLRVDLEGPLHVRRATTILVARR